MHLNCLVCNVGMKEKPSRVGKEKISFKGTLALSVLGGMDVNGMIEI